MQAIEMKTAKVWICIKGVELPIHSHTSNLLGMGLIIYDGIVFNASYYIIPGTCPTKYRIDQFDPIQNLLKILVPLISITVGLS